VNLVLEASSLHAEVMREAATASGVIAGVAAEIADALGDFGAALRQFQEAMALIYPAVETAP